jgi:hypothetical protein
MAGRPSRSAAGDEVRRHTLYVARRQLGERDAAEGRSEIHADVLLTLSPGRGADALALAYQPSGEVGTHCSSAGGLKAAIQVGAQGGQAAADVRLSLP